MSLPHLELFFGDANPAETRVYARLAGEHPGADWSLAGSATGPFCEYAHTLTASVPLVDLGPGPSLLAQAVVVDPCFWTPDLPYLYCVRVELRRGADVVAQEERWLGLRPLGAEGPRLRLAGKRWALRGVTRSEVEADLQQWHEAGVAMLVDDPDESLSGEASRLGVLLVARLQGSAATVQQQLEKLSRFAAVGLAVLETDEPERLSGRGLGHNLVLAQRFAPGQLVLPAAWAHAAVVEMTSAEEFAGQVAGCRLPVVALRRAGPQPSLAAARLKCDKLQGELAGRAEVAGYLV